MGSVVRSVRASEEEWAAWEVAAGVVSLNAWVRSTLNEQVQLVAALGRVEADPVEERALVVQRLREVPGVTVGAAVAAPSVRSGVCPRAHYHRPGRYCTICDKSF